MILEISTDRKLVWSFCRWESSGVHIASTPVEGWKGLVETTLFLLIIVSRTKGRGAAMP